MVLKTIDAIYDGEVIRPDSPLKLIWPKTWMNIFTAEKA